MTMNMRLNDEKTRGHARACYKTTSGCLWSYKKTLVALLALLFVIFIVIKMQFGGGDFSTFTYPLEIDNFTQFINEIDSRNEQSKQGGALASLPQTTKLMQIIQDVIHSNHLVTRDGHPIVPYTNISNLEFTIDVNKSCESSFKSDSDQALPPLSVIVVIKSAVNNYDKRRVIRQTWALNDKVVEPFKFKTVFIIGACDKINPVPKWLAKQNNGIWTVDDCKQATKKEALQYDDLVQSSGFDSYYNLTVKTSMMLRWVSERCQSDFFLVLDDDYAFEVVNWVRYVQNLALKGSQNGSQDNNKTTSSNLTDNVDKTRAALMKLARGQLYTGFLRDYSSPIRTPLHKYRISYEDYPFNKYPQFITGGQVLMTHNTVRHLYLATYFTQAIKFEDVYMGIMAYKLGLKPIHEENFMCLPEDYMASKPIHPNATNCIGVHEIETDYLLELWRQRRHEL